MLDITPLGMTNTLVTLTKEFAMKLPRAAKFANLVIAAALFTPLALAVLQQAARLVA